MGSTLSLSLSLSKTRGTMRNIDFCLSFPFEKERSKEKEPCIMSRFRSNTLLFLLLFVFSTLFFFSHGDSPLRHSPTQELANERQNNGVVEWDKRRFLDEASNQSVTLILAANRTRRRDPLDGFKYYTGGWDITNKHYLASAGFRAAPLFIVAAVWFVVFGICLFCICLRHCLCCCCRKQTIGYSPTAYALSLIFLLLFTVAAIIGSVYLYRGQGKFQTTIVNVLSYVLKQADTTIERLTDLMNHLLEVRKIGIGQAVLPPDLLDTIDEMQGTMNGIIVRTREVTGTSSKGIRDFLDPVRVALIYVSAVTLVLAFFGFLFSILGLQCLVYILCIIGWIAVVGTFILSGIFLLVHTAVADTCVAVDEWLQNPTANSALEDIIPKVDDQTAKAIMQGTKGVTFALVNATNTVIAQVYNVNMPPQAGALYTNQSGPPLPLLCNPYDVDLTDRNCSHGEVKMKNAEKVWKKYVCEVSASGICTTRGRITPEGYNNLTATAEVTHGMYRNGPFLVDLADSTYLKQLLTDISKTHCPSMRQSTEWAYVGFTVISASVMLSCILWIVYARERKHRKYTLKCLSAASHSGGGSGHSKSLSAASYSVGGSGKAL